MYCDLVIKRSTNCHYVLNKINKLEKKKLVLAHLIILEDFCSSSAGIFSFALSNSWSFSCTDELTASSGGPLESSVLAMVESLVGFTFPNWKVSLLWNSTLDAWRGDTNITSFQCSFHFQFSQTSLKGTLIGNHGQCLLCLSMWVCIKLVEFKETARVLTRDKEHCNNDTNLLFPFFVLWPLSRGSCANITKPHKWIISLSLPSSLWLGEWEHAVVRTKLNDMFWRFILQWFGFHFKRRWCMFCLLGFTILDGPGRLSNIRACLDMVNLSNTITVQ